MEDDLIGLMLLDETAIDNGGRKSKKGNGIELHDADNENLWNEILCSLVQVKCYDSTARFYQGTSYNRHSPKHASSSR